MFPSHSAGVVGPVEGRFVDYGDKVLLTDMNGNDYNLGYVRVIPGMWGGKEEGVEKWPRVWIYNPETGEAEEEGDYVLIFFLNGSHLTPVVMGTARALNANEIYTQDQTDGDPNVYFARAASMAAGVVTGKADVRHENGVAYVRASESLELAAGPDDGGVASVKTKLANGKVTVTLAGIVSPEPPLRGTTFLGDLSASLTELAAAPTALGLPTTNTLAMIASITASLALGAPYLSTTVETE